MASTLYTNGKDKFLAGEIDWASDTIHAALVAVGGGAGEYTIDVDADEFLEAIDSDARIADHALASKTIANGAVDAADTVFPAVTGDPFQAVVLYKLVTNDADSPLIAYIESVEVSPIGTDITISWSNGTSKIFRLV